MTPIPTTELRFDRETWRSFIRHLRALINSEVGWKAALMLVGLFAFLAAISSLNVLGSYVGRDFMTAIAERDRPSFTRHAIQWIGVFALSTLVAVVYRFTEERLGLLWREWLTRRIVDRYLADRAYYFLKVAGTLHNPDQRIADDVRTFTITTLSLVLMVANGTITILAFGGVLLSISVPLTLVAVGYAVLGSLLTVRLGRPLIGLNYDQADREAEFRASLLHVGEHAESVALLRREGRVKRRMLDRLAALVANMKRIIAVNRNLGYFTTSYNYLIQLIPALMIAPAYMRGEVEFGVITQSAIAFTQLMGAFSLVVTQFPAISTQAVVIARIDALRGSMREAASPTNGVVVREESNRVAWEQLTLRSPRDGRVLVDSLNVTVVERGRLLVRGPNETAKVALFRATAGIWQIGEGQLVRPARGEILFVTERPYLPPGTLREAVAPHDAAPVDHDAAHEVLHELGLEKLLVRAGGLDVERDWSSMLSLDEQQLLAIARLLLARPRFAVLDRIATALLDGQVAQVFTALAGAGVAYVAIGEADVSLEHFDAVLELGEAGVWTWSSVT